MRTLVVVTLLLAAVTAAAQAPANQPARPQAPAQVQSAKPAAAKLPEYDPAAETKIKGVVEDFHQGQAKADHPGLHLMLRTETELVEVHTCPVRFMKDLEFAIEKGDTLTVTGSRPGGTGILLAREITKGQTSLIVRDKTGAPAWTR